MKDKIQWEEAEIEVLLKYANSIIATLREPFLVLDKKLNVISANQAFYSTFNVAEKETIGRSFSGLGNKQWNIPKLLQLLVEIIPDKKVVRDYEVENNFSHIGHRVMLLNAIQLSVPKKVAAIIAAGVIGEGGEEEELILLAIEDITERKRLQEELKESEERYRRAFETSRDGLLLVHKIEGTILNSNESIQELLGYSHRDLLKMKLWEIGVTTDKKDFTETLVKLEKDGVIHYEDVQVLTHRGLGVNAEVFLVNKAKVLQCNIRDTTENKKIQDEIKDKMEDLEKFSRFAVDRELKMEKLEKKEKELEEKLKNR
jgi:PAS domain S-box-containing protein